MFQVYKTFKQTIAYTSISIEEYIDAVKNGKFNSEQITELRSLDKTTDKKRYNELKLSCNCITINFQFKGIKNNDNIIGSTGFLYLDIDDKSFNINQLNLNDIVCCHKSCGGLGWSIIVKVNGLTLSNYKATVELIAKEMGLEQYIDKGAKKATQYLVISNDQDIIVNLTPKTWDAAPTVHNEMSESKGSKKDQVKNIKTLIDPNDTFFLEEIDLNNLKGDIQWINNELVDTTTGEIITNTIKTTEIRTTRLNNIHDYDIEGVDFQLFKEKINIVEVFIPSDPKTKLPKSIPSGKRNVFINSICQNFLWLNQWISEIRLINWLVDINNICNCCMQMKEIETIAKYYYTKLVRNELTPNYNKARRCAFNKESKLTKEEKVLKVNKEMGKFRTKNTQDSIMLAIEDLTQKGLKPTQKNIAEITGKSLVTIKRHWKEIKKNIK